MKRRLKKRILCLLATLLILSTPMLSVLSVRAEGDSLPETVTVSEPKETAGNETAPEDEGNFSVQSIEVLPEGENSDKRIVLEGLMPENVTAEAVDVTEERNSNVIAAYDITLTDGEEEFQPDEENPINVEISDERITTVNNTLELWHVLDDGTRVQVTDFTMEEGKISFAATGFSVYEIVDGPDDPYEVNPESVSDLAGFTSSDAAEGFYLCYYPEKSTSPNYFGNTINSKDCIEECTSVSAASVWYMEEVESTATVYKCKLYTMVGSARKYLHQKVANSNLVELVDSVNDATVIEISVADNAKFYLKHTSEKRYLQHSGSGGGIRFYTDNNNVYNSRICAIYASSIAIPKDPYDLDGRTVGLMYCRTGIDGNAMMAEKNGNNNQLKSNNLLTRKNTVDGDEEMFVAADSDITMWTFTSTSSDYYLVSSNVGGVTKYLKLDASGLTLVDSETEATPLLVTPRNGKIKLSAGGKAISYNNGVFVAANDDTSDNNYLSFATLSHLSEEDFVVYSAYKVGVSDRDTSTGEYLVPDGAKVIVYTRIWDDTTKTYNFYAVDHDGSLVPCYEKGDNIMWVGNRINTLLWDFTEYHYDDGTPNYYYELQNEYSGKFLAPQIKDNQVLADKKIGINLPGRRDDQYFTDILAWDDPYYSYAGIKTDIASGKIVSCAKKNSDTFYFALMESVVPNLTVVETIDNNKYGITMKMKDLTNRNQMSTFLGSNEYTETKDLKKTVPGLLTTDLGDDGYPKTDLTSVEPGYVKGKSLGELYSGAENVNHLFLDSTYDATGYFEFDSAQNFATLTNDLDENGARNFRVYKEIGTTDSSGKDSLKHGQFLPYNDITPGKFAKENKYNMFDALINPLPDEDPRKGEQLYLVNGTTNYQFAAEIEAGFVQTPNGDDAWGHDIIFEFTGDDDFWLYVDGELVIDLGGIHSALEGSVNFATGEVHVNNTQTTLRELFKQNYIKRGMSESEAETEVAKIFREKVVGNETYYVFNDYSEHKMKIFYMERGAGASNLHMRFNLSYVTPGSVMLSKQITGTEELEDDMDFSLVEFPYQILYRYDDGDDEEGWLRLKNNNQNIQVAYQNSTQKVEYRASYKPPKATQTFEDVYFINPGMVAEIRFPENTYKYKIIECAVNKEVYDTVSVEGVSTDDLKKLPVAGNADRKSYELKGATVDERKTVAFNNHVNKYGLRTLSVTKKLLDENGDEVDAVDDPSTFSFRLYLTNGSDDASGLELANMYRYRVRNKDDELCRWNAAIGTFESIGETEYSALSDTLKESVTFETSMNGAISRIPAGYTVDVPNLPVGTIFKVEERADEIPLGYTFKEYIRDPRTYAIDDGDTPNSGRVRKDESPSMTVVNRRGWELQVTKDWTDQGYISTRDSVYTAVYANGTLIDGTVRQLKHPQTTLRYYFEDLLTGCTFDDYQVFEVELEGATFDAEGNLSSYDSIKKKLAEGDLTTVGAVPKGGSEKKGFSYSVSYQKGQAYKTASDAPDGGNVREDTIINTRTGGIVLNLYEMGSNKTKPLASGIFTLQRYDKLSGEYINEGTYTSDENGRITILYEHKLDTEAEYILTQTASPKGYIGLEHPVKFSVSVSDDIFIDSDNGPKWQDWDKPDVQTDKLIAYINVYNKPYTLEVYKYDGSSTGVGGLKEAHFELHRGVAGGQGGIVKDYVPMAGYEDLVTGNNGIINGIDSNLAPNNYYLTEKTPPEGYTGLEGDVIFEITSLGRLELISSPVGSNVTLESGEYGDVYRYLLKIPNTKTDKVNLTVSKTVTGNFGNKDYDFSFIFTTTDTDETEYSYEIIDEDGNPTEGLTIKSNQMFTLSHGQKAIFDLPKDTEVTIEEFDYSTTGYTTTVAVDSQEPQAVRTVTGTISADATYAYTNAKSGLVPTGVWMPIGGMIAMALILLTGMIFTFVNKGRFKRQL